MPDNKSKKGYPFEVLIPDEIIEVKGAILFYQVKSLDWKAKIKFIYKLPSEEFNKVIEKLIVLVCEKL
ncbi:type II toxin-antitoxin system PemK/MazF family toxin [Thermodesulfobium sp. 4217-1]